MLPLATPASQADAVELRGDLAMWLLIGIETLSFGLLFLAFAFARSREPAVFAAGQGTLDLGSGALNTAVLLLGSWAVARGVHALRCGRNRSGVAGLWGAALCGLVFLGSKALEYRKMTAAGHDLATDTFFTFYYLLTGFHVMHVLAAVLMLAGMALLARDGRWSRGDTHAPDTVAAFWHMVDLLWIVLFPLVYVLR
ncbi:nitric oxide reductase NorE protein [Inhella inkyongensis]|uniref:Nitric oxide reductase NorE protein n=1 Tax=Inhella inkyongensis TaxID=392593 RepID=A0A840S474_9BURK|nr:cytochrome c oxidase subunit 3 [Inhella inkyongensis]MBB5203340.1 nitric oxide reductase NorE protein [Inhella inkyongensis]